MSERDDADKAREAATGAEEARAAAVDAREGAADAEQEAVQARDAADRSRQQAAAVASGARSGLENSQADVEDLLIHPDDRPQQGDDDPFGKPGPAISRRSPFFVGFVGGLGVLLALLAGMAIQQAESVLVLIVVSFFLAVGLNPVVEFLMHRGIRRSWSVLLVTLGVLAMISLFVVALVPVLRDQIDALVTSAPTWLDQLQRNSTVKDLDGRYDVIDTVREKLQDPALAERAFGSIFTAGLAVLNALLNAFLIFVLTLYFLSALPKIKKSCYSLAPPPRRERVTSLGDEILRRVGGYVAGAFVVALCAGVSSFIFLQFAGLAKYALALSVVVALLDFIPLIGATIGAGLVTIVGFATSPTIGIACLIFYLIYQQVENYVVYPRVMKSSVDVPGVVTVIAVLVGGSLMGVVGALLAIPTAAATLLVLRETVVKKREDEARPAISVESASQTRG